MKTGSISLFHRETRKKQTLSATLRLNTCQGSLSLKAPQRVAAESAARRACHHHCLCVTAHALLVTLQQQQHTA